MWIEDLKTRVAPDVVLTHRRDDGHPGPPRGVATDLERVPRRKRARVRNSQWDGDLGQPNLYVAMSDGVTMQRKLEVLKACFGTQRGKDWFDADTFRGLARLRGMECRAPERYAGGFCPGNSMAELEHLAGSNNFVTAAIGGHCWE